MPATTVTAVQAVLGTNWDGTTDLTPFIDTADVVMGRVKTCAFNKGNALSDVEVEVIERWLAAHYYCVQDPTYKSRNTASASGSFQGNTDMYLESTPFGQQAARLDWSGCLQAIAGKQRASASLIWLGGGWPYTRSGGITD